MRQHRLRMLRAHHVIKVPQVVVGEVYGSKHFSFREFPDQYKADSLSFAVT